MLTEEIIQTKLDMYYDRYLQDINKELPKGFYNIRQKYIQLIFVNGRYHGLMPGDSPENYYGGHPGLFYQLLLNALCLNIPHVLIIMSAKQDEAPGGKFPIASDKKGMFIHALIEIMKDKLVDNIIIAHPELEEYREQLKERVSRIDVTTAPMGAGYPLLHTIYNEKREKLHIPPDQTMMVTGLEEVECGKKRTQEKECGWYNKYASTFPGVKFLLLGRSGGISGTKIRAAIDDLDYYTIAQWLIDAKMTDDKSLILVGKIIHSINHSIDTDSQEEAAIVAEHIGLIEYEELKDSITESQSAGKNRKKSRKHKRKNIKKTRKHKRKHTKRNKKSNGI